MAGPLDVLYTNPSGIPNNFNLKYPRDLSSPNNEYKSGRKPHYVLFSIFESKSNLSGGTSAPSISVDEKEVSATNLTLNPTVKQINEIRTNASGFTRRTFSTQTTIEPVGNIALYIPDEVAISQNSQYGEVSLEDALNTIVPGGAVKALTSFIKKNDASGAPGALLLNYFGYVFNPQEQLMFEGIDFRKYNMSFTFTPFDEKEAQEVSNIVQTFRQHAAPRIVPSSLGFFFTPPSQFNISYRLADGTDNPFINKFKRSVLEDVSVNYAPNGWSAHKDGAPVQTTLTLSFRELELVDKTDIQNGY